ncbi:hypothetical protein OIU76_012391 [Salix suchowensis]|nr:hypothetical protein OIU76_012391 [Salix suchowensis]
MKAKLDPPGLEEREIPDNMDPAFHGSTETDLDREFFIELWNTPGFLADARPMMTLRSILTRLEQGYCGSIGYEYMHINDKEKCNWLREKIETSTPMTYARCSIGASDLGVENIVVGMPHRGRLNVLGNVFRKPLAQISSEFDKNAKPVEEVGFTREEPMNMGASSYIAPRLCTAMKATGRGSWEDIKFVGRGPSASTATGLRPGSQK